MGENHPSGEPPGPRQWPVVGNTLQFARAPFAFREYCAATYGDVVALEIAGDQSYMVTDPGAVRQVLVTKHDSFRKGDELQRRLSSLLGDGLLLSEGAFWQRQRQLIQPMFYRERLATYTDMITGYADRLTDDWADGDRRDVQSDMVDVTLQVLAKALFDEDIHGERSVIGEAADVIVDKFDLARVSTYLPEWTPTPTNVRYRRAIAELESLIAEMITARRNADQPPDDLLTRLIEAGDDDERAMSDETLRDEVMTFLLAGHETTALVLTYSLYLLGTNPATQRRVQAELDAELAGTHPTMADLPDLAYTERVIRESMRLYPPIHTLLREPTEPVEIGGYRIPAGALVSTPQWVVHHDARWYDDPWQFDPDRWHDSKHPDRPEFAYFPFGGGPRRCIGEQFATIEAQLVLATILQEFTVEVPNDDLSLAASLTTRPRSPIEAIVHER
ncbi:cytochrome P450 [Halorientalis brevis]|uniref:Cytochrome P450 n=1 Tax=Halorientalis brevis TaxID=1126241 RepID=A0ABD6CER6_9EURY|nr:cytochrome P450 [Halorientalis brevis]